METETINETEGKNKSAVARRFRGFLPVIIDVETAGFNAATDALLEIAAVTVTGLLTKIRREAAARPKDVRDSSGYWHK